MPPSIDPNKDHSPRVRIPSQSISVPPSIEMLLLASHKSVLAQTVVIVHHAKMRDHASHTNHISCNGIKSSNNNPSQTKGKRWNSYNLNHQGRQQKETARVMAAGELRPQAESGCARVVCVVEPLPGRRSRQTPKMLVICSSQIPISKSTSP